MIGRGVAPTSALTHARILLKANQGEAGPSWTDAAIGAALEVNPATVARVRMKYVAAGLDAAIYRKPPARSYRRRLESMSTTRMPSGSCWSKTTPNTHTPASLDAAFGPAEARRLADRLELHYTPSMAAG
jgi:hypothetical protein